jgi:uncharacterized iron-regulated protein
MISTRGSMLYLVLVFVIGSTTGNRVKAQVPGESTPVFDSASEVFISIDEMVERLATADVIYVGESHTDYAHHLAQLEILKALHQSTSTVVMGWEMFHSSQQPLLDAYTGGWLPEVEWLDAIYWEETWGYPYPYYKPLLDYARDNDMRVFGLNAPR